MSERQSYASSTAITQAREMGLNFSHAVWRQIFLAITDSLIGEQEAIGLTAHLRGPVRDGRERWELRFPRIHVECIYDPKTALVVSLLPPRASESAPAPSGPAPRQMAEAG